VDSFLVQVWVPVDDTLPETDLRGVVRHVATGVETRFRGDTEVLRLLQGARAQPTAGEEPARRLEAHPKATSTPPRKLRQGRA